MPHQLAKEAFEFSKDVATLKAPADVLWMLQKIVEPYDINVFNAGIMPTAPAEFVLSSWKPGVTIFFGKNTPKDFWPQYQKAHAVHGFGALGLQARRTTRSFTFAECMLEQKSQTCGSWLFEFLRSFDIRDGFCCSFRSWNLIYSSPRLLALSPPMRSELGGLAHTAVSRLEAITKAKASEADMKAIKELTAREMDVLQERARLHTNVAIARELGIDRKTVDELLRRARIKLGAPDVAIALLTAYKRGLIVF